MSATTKFESTFAVPKMDCPSEENMIKMALQSVEGVQSLTFDLPGRKLVAVHRAPVAEVLQRLEPLGLGAKLVHSAAVDDSAAGSFKSTFHVPKMDCPSEENMIKLALQDVPGVKSLSFDLANRKLTAVHGAPVAQVLQRLEPLGLGAKLLESDAVMGDDDEIDPPDNAAEARLLWILLSINAAMFVIEIVMGFIAQSTGLIADSLDMFADAAVYGLSLFAVGRAAALKTRAAHTAGWLQLALAFMALSEVVRRFIAGSEPVSGLMMGMGLVALIANVICLVLISKKRDAGAHMKASYIFSANDVIANAGVILAGFLVAMTGSNYPDLVIGTVVGLIVLNGARRILSLK